MKSSTTSDNKIILISEIFGPVCQGEGEHIGVPTVFVRTGGCDYMCSWCDTLYAVLPKYNKEWLPLTPTLIVQTVNALTRCRPILVTLSGGNPAMQKNLGVVIDMLHATGHTVTIETQGTVYPDWAHKLDHITLSPKPPSSLMQTNYEQLDHWIHGEDHVFPVLKIVVFDEQDYVWAKQLHERYSTIKMYLQVGNNNRHISADDMQASREELLGGLRWLQQRVLDDGWYSCTVLPQLHVLLFGSKRGV